MQQRRYFHISAWAILFVFLLMAVPQRDQVNAGGPLYVSDFGRPFIWGAAIGRGLPWTPDQGRLGRLSNADAVKFVSDSFLVWQNVPLTRAKFIQSGQLSVDVTASNFMSIVDGLVDDCLNSAGCITPIVFDTDGRIIDAVFGRGASSQILGFAGPTVFRGSNILQGRAVINGRFGLNDLKGTMIHEFGHLMGLDHTQVNASSGLDFNTANDNEVPTMFPFIVGDSENLHLDDMTAIGFLYPSQTFLQRGQISGQVLLSNGTGFQGVNVIARKVDDPKFTAVSSVSGFLHSGTRRGDELGSMDPALLGFYQIVGLPDGRYTVEVEAIRPFFSDGSSVGPLNPPAELFAPFEYYSGDAESASDDPTGRVEIEIMGGNRVVDINIILNGDSKLGYSHSQNHSPTR
jgi:hypothetical protein